jgi:hypothetical protein
MPPVGFEPTISAGERQQTYALDRAATGTGDTVKLATVKWTRSVPLITEARNVCLILVGRALGNGLYKRL